jgi:Uma2 family endonuclease
MQGPPALMTVEEFYTWSCQEEYDDLHVELARGRPVVQSLPDQMHGAVCGTLGFHLGQYVRERRRGYVCLGAAFIVQRNPDTVYAPDVGVYDKSVRYEDLSDTWTEDTPAFIAEVLQHGESLDYLLSKAADYLACGVKEVWIAHPVERWISIHRPGAPAARLSGEDVLQSAQTLPGFRLPVSSVFTLPCEE